MLASFNEYEWLVHKLTRGLEETFIMVCMHLCLD